MMPISLLMIEHRLIERMIKYLAAVPPKLGRYHIRDIAVIETAVDFIRTYADKCHHGKEEDILFRELAKKKMSPEHKRTMDELVQEHALGRKSAAKLTDAAKHYMAGDRAALTAIVKEIQILVDFYPKHIEKEDKRFFIPAMEYFTKEEQAAMLAEENEFDRKMIHDKYRGVVERLESMK